MHYKNLFNLNFYHAYFLDEGKNKYNKPGLDDIVKEEREKRYDSASFLKIQPTRTTVETMKNHRILCKEHTKGIQLLVSTNEEVSQDGGDEVKRYSPIISLDNEIKFTFYLYAMDARFYNYTAGISKTTKKLHYLTNTATSVNNIFLTDKNLGGWNGFKITTRETRKLVYDLAQIDDFTTNTPQLITIATIKEEDIEAMEDELEKVNPILTEEQEENLKLLNEAITIEKNKGIIGIVQLYVKGDNDFNLTEEIQVKNPTSGLFDIQKECLLESAPQFKIYINNRKTFWRYTLLVENKEFRTKTKKPLTKNGTIEIDRSQFKAPKPKEMYFPNPTVDLIKEEEGDYYSEIFI